MEKDKTHRYDDLIMMPHPRSKTHAQMSRLNRAAQFAPFAALTGHQEAIVETGRVTDEKKVLDEHKKGALDELLQEILVQIKTHPLVKITYFQSDTRKNGGYYLITTEAVKKVDEYNQTLILMNGTKLYLDDIYELEIIENEDECKKGRELL